MIRIVFYLILVIVVFVMYVPYRNIHIDPELQPYVSKFMDKVNSHCREDQYFYPNHQVIFGDLSNNTIGICMPFPFKFTIIIDKEYWVKMKDEDKYQLVSHELCHCLFNEKHSEDENHYMYYKHNDITLENIDKQIDEYLEKKCGK
jgi:hypothetical protein